MAKPTVYLLGTDGNAFSIMGAVIKALREAGADDAIVKGYQAEAMDGDYDHLLRVTMKYVNVE